MLKWIGLGVSIVVIGFLLVALYAILNKNELILRSEANLANKIDSTVKYLKDYHSKESNKPLKRLLFSNELDRYTLEYLQNHQIVTPTDKLIVLYDASPSKNATIAAIITTNSIIYYMNSAITRYSLKEIDSNFNINDSLGLLIKNSSGIPIKLSFDNNYDRESFATILHDVKADLIGPKHEDNKPSNQDDNLYDSLLQIAR